MTRRRIAAIGVAAALLTAGGLLAVEPVSWAAVKAGVRQAFPDVRQIEAATLASWMESKIPAPLILDVRATAEYDISHLRGARRINPEADPTAALAGVPEDRLIVAYCSVGWRSSAFVERMQKAGFTNVYNLEGSLFAWANAGRPMVRSALGAERPANRVHPYDAAWGRLLDADRRATVP